MVKNLWLINDHFLNLGATLPAIETLAKAMSTSALGCSWLEARDRRRFDPNSVEMALA
jgi:hypothetical protein